MKSSSTQDIRSINTDRFGAAFAKANREKLEKIVPGYNNLQQLAWLRQGLARATSVGRIVTPDGLGTGWLVSHELILTNNHVLDRQPKPQECWIEFNYEVDWNDNPSPVERYEIDQLVKTDPNLDYSILSVKGRPGEKFGFVDIRDAREPSLTSSATHYPVIIQHPQGGYKQVALTDNFLVTMDEQLVWYTTDTEPGSSGSPVFDQLWRPFALHHAGGPKKLPDGKVVILNEGIILARIVKHAAAVLGTSERLPAVVRDLLVSGCFADGRTTVTLEWYLNNPQLHDAIKHDALGNKEIGPLLAAAAGVAAGAAAAHWAHVTSKKEVASPYVRLGTLEVALKVTGTGSSIGAVFDELYRDIKGRPDTVDHVRNVDSEEYAKLHEIAPLAAAFLAGVAAGAAAYKVGK